MSYAVNYRLGQEAIFHYGAAGSTAATVFGLVKTTSFSIERNAVEGVYRDSMWSNTRSGSGKLNISVTGRRKSSDTTYAALRAAAHAAIGAGTAIAVKLIPVSGATDDTIDADFSVMKFECDESSDGYQEFKMELALNIDERAPTFT